MKKILILGSDFGTLQVVREAHKLGLHVTVADLMETSPTKEEADEAWLISTTDTETLVKKCREENIEALMFGASDFNVGNAREVCKRLRLPIYCDSDYACRVARDKVEFKRICRDVGAPVARGYFLTDDLSEDALNKVEFPVVVKPADKSGNRGMSYCANRDELIRGYRAAREISDKEIVVERQLRGISYNIHYVLADGHARLLHFRASHNEPGELANLYSLGCTTSCHLKQYLEEVNDRAIAVIERAGCREGIVWFDCIRDEDGHFYLLEMGYRIAGVMTYVPYERVTGFNTFKWMLECALGVRHTEKDMPPALDKALAGCAATYHLFSRKNGRLGRIEGLREIERLPGVFVDMPKREGNAVRAGAQFGMFGIYGENIETVCQRIGEINSLLKTLDDGGENLLIYFDDCDSLREDYYTGLRQFGL